MSRKLSILLCFSFLLTPILFADWDEGQPFKWLQRPDLTPTGIDICIDDSGELGQRTIGDDFLCSETGPITGVHIWGSWKGDIKGNITSIHLSFYTDKPADPADPESYSQPDMLLWERWFDSAQIRERLYYTLPEEQYEWWWDPRSATLIPTGDTQIWQYNIDIPNEPFIQEGTPDRPIIYWLVVEVKIDQTIDNSSFGWKTRDRQDGHFMDDAAWQTPTAIPWHELRYPLGHPYNPDSLDMAFVLTTEEQQDDLDFGGAPEGPNALAYPSMGVIGQFPTCITVGSATWIQHTNFGARFGPMVDFEPDGNAGLCPTGTCFPPYDQDECFQDGDAGLLFPDSFTIDGALNVVTCTGITPGTSLGQTCTTAIWGTNIDIDVTNFMPNDTPGYVNVLVDWNQDGQWAGSSTCPTGAVPEHVLVDFKIPNGYSGPLSGLMTPGFNDFFTIGPNSGYVWVRFSITEAPVAAAGIAWDGSGRFEDGETEDYLLKIDPLQTEEIDFGDAPDSAAALGYPTLAANSGASHIIGGPWLGDASDSPDPELDGQPTGNADGDDNDGNDDEDGVQIPVLIVGQAGTITFEVNSVDGSGGMVSAWIDYNKNKVWGDIAAEQIIAASYPNGVYSVSVTPPNGSAGKTYARFRISRDAAAMVPTGQAADGEVEDYLVRIQRKGEDIKFQQQPLDGMTIGNVPYYGHDELSTAYRNPDNPNLFQGCYMADDFADLKHSPVIRVKWWGSYIQNEITEPVERFLIAFERDVPAQGHPDDIDYIPSHPGEVILSQFVHRSASDPMNPGEFTETWISPGGPPCNENLFEYEALLENPFAQDPDTVYWIKIVAMVDDPAAWLRLEPALMNSGLSLCEFLNLPFNQQSEYGLQMPLTRWGWHNRDYTKFDPYASTPPAVVPGEHNPRLYIPTLPPIGGLDDTDVWHFQDDAVSGEVFIDEAAPDMPFVEQPRWIEEYYKYSLPYCTSPAIQGIDGPDEITYYSKDLAFELWTPTESNGTDFGDAPEGGVAYPGSGVMGQFPTCITVGPAGWIQHTNFGAYFGPTVDSEADGNAGLCPGGSCFPPYDQDECYADGDAGLLMPDSFTIDSSSYIVQCTSSGSTGAGTCIGTPCQSVIWGTNIDINVSNFMPSSTVGYVNLLIDWNQDGLWNGTSTCPSGTVIPEHVLVDFPVPNGYSGPLSNLLPPAFTIGPTPGFVWVRFSITERPVGTSDWDGSGIFEDGETEDYLIRICPTCQDYNLTKLTGGTDDLVNVQDLNLLVNYVNTNKTGALWVVTPTNPAWDPAYNITAREGSTDMLINVQDLNALVNYVNTTKTGAIWVVNCKTCGC